MFGVVEKSEILTRRKDYLLSVGIRVEQLEDFSKVKSLVSITQKNYLTPLASPEKNDLTHGNCIWLIGWYESEPVILGGARLEDLQGEPVTSFWPRSLGRLYGRDPQALISAISEEVAKRLRGRLAYFGDLHVAKNNRGSLANLRAFTTIGHLAVSLQWNPDHTYAFVREDDVMRGAAARYGFCDMYVRPITWVDPPPPRSDSE